MTMFKGLMFAAAIVGIATPAVAADTIDPFDVQIQGIEDALIAAGLAAGTWAGWSEACKHTNAAAAMKVRDALLAHVASQEKAVRDHHHVATDWPRLASLEFEVGYLRFKVLPCDQTMLE